MQAVDKLDCLKERLRQERINNKFSTDMNAVKLTTQDNNNRLYNLERGFKYGPKVMTTPIRPESKKSLFHFQFKDFNYDVNDKRLAMVAGVIIALGVVSVLILGTCAMIGVI